MCIKKEHREKRDRNSTEKRWRYTPRMWRGGGGDKKTLDL